MTLHELMPVASHLWQSTLFAAAVYLLTLLLRNNHAQTRYLLWLAASMKFVVPFSSLVAVGRMVEWRSAATSVPPAVFVAAEQLSDPFVFTIGLMKQVQPSGPWGRLLLAAWGAGAIVVLMRWFLNWRRLDCAKRRATPLELGLPIEARSTATVLEPGVFGLFRPVLLLPAGIEEKLTPEQLKAIVVHELCHVKRRDNLAAALHMLVEAVFWFHPLVWWIGARLVEERENACDQAVVHAGNHPSVYAESILNVCKFYLESPLRCAAGVSGADLRRRIESIMTGRDLAKLSTARKMLLASAAIVALGAPMAVGVATAPRSSVEGPENFDVASIRPSSPDARGMSIQLAPGGGLNMTGAPLRELIMFAYDVRSFQVTGGPGWINTERFDIKAKPSPGGGPSNPREMSEEQGEAFQTLMRKRVGNLLGERFQLKLTAEDKELPVYHLVEAKGGTKLKPAENQTGTEQRVQNGRGEMSAMGVRLRSLLMLLSSAVGRPVLDRTGLNGLYDIKLEWTPDGAPSSVDGPGPTIFTAIQEQLGLKLESAKGPVITYRVDRVQKPTAN